MRNMLSVRRAKSSTILSIDEEIEELQLMRDIMGGEQPIRSYAGLIRSRSKLSNAIKSIICVCENGNTEESLKLVLKIGMDALAEDNIEITD